MEFVLGFILGFLLAYVAPLIEIKRRKVKTENPTDEEKRKALLTVNTEINSIESNIEVKETVVAENNENAEKIELFQKGISTLTVTEKMIFDLYLEGNGTKDVLAKMNIKENTLKYHNKNIYGKLGVSSRKQLLEIANKISVNK